MDTLRRNATGSAVGEVRGMLASIGLLDNTRAEAAERFDEPTELAVRHFQQTRGITVTGEVDLETYTTLLGAHWQLGDRVLAHDAGQVAVGDDVAELQRQLMGLGYDIARADGIFGLLTAAGLREFQRDSGLVPDGICGPATLAALRRLGRRVVGGRPQLLRESAAVAAAGPNLLGKRIVIDPGHGGGDSGFCDGEITEAELVWDMASRLEGRLSALGIRAWLTRGPHNGATDEERAAFANNIGADVVLSLHVDGFESPHPNGIASYHYGGHATTSTIGERLADLAQRELVARTGLLDGRVHGKSWTLLRLTRMPAVQVEVGYLTSPVDRPRLLDPATRDAVAEGLLVAIQRLYLPENDDPTTGMMKLSEIAGRSRLDRRPAVAG